MYSEQKYNHRSSKQNGFTIVELLIVIVVIGILAAITIVAYTGISQQASATALKSDLSQAKTQLELAKVQSTDSTYPISPSGTNPPASLKPSPNTTLQYTVDNTSSPATYCLSATNSATNQAFHLDSTVGAPEEGVCEGHTLPDGGSSVLTSASCFAFNGGTNTITGYYSYEGNNSANPTCPRDVEMPDNISGIEVKSIGNSAFYNKQLTSVNIPSSIILIGQSAFSNNQLSALVIPSSVTSIGSRAFNNNQLSDDQAFILGRNSSGQETDTLVSYGGSKRSNVIIPSTVTSIGSSAFNNLELNSVTIPNSVTTIGGSAFYNNQLTSVIIPSSVTTIEQGAFQSNQLSVLTIPNSVTSLGQHAFESNLLTSVVIPNSISKIDAYVFIYNQLESINIPGSITTIEQGAFENNQLSSLAIPNSVSYIAGWAFSSNQLTNINFGSSVTTIGQGAFSDNLLTSVTIPSSVNWIFTNAFSNNPEWGSSIVCNIATGKTYTAYSNTGCDSFVYY